jgi:CheY-like chemotaxis protein
MLLVEDNVHNLDLMSYLLTAAGHAVTSAATGAEGLRQATICDPELVVLDLQLPDMDGYEVLRRIRRLGTARTPVVAVTAYAMVGDRANALAEGFDGYFAKPIDPRTFADAIGAYLTSDLGKGIGSDDPVEE